MIPKLIPIKDLRPFAGLIFDVSKIPVIRYEGKKPCRGQFNMLPEGKFFLHTSGSYFLKGKGPDKEGYRMLPMFNKNPEEYGTKCFPWVARRRNNGTFVPCKMSKKKTDYIEVRFQITVEELKAMGREDMIRKKPKRKSIHDPWTRNECDVGHGMSICIHTLLGYALFPQYFQTPQKKWVINHKAENYDYRLSQLSLTRFSDNYLRENLYNTEEKWIRELMGRQRFSHGGLVGG